MTAVASLSHSEIFDTPFGRIEAPVGDVITEQLRAVGGHQRSDLAAALSFVRAGDTVLDIGAHVGTFAVPFARTVGAHGRVVAFEPTPRSHAFLRANVEHNQLPQVTPVHALVGDAAGRYRAAAVDGNSGMTWFEPDPEGDLPALRLDAWWAEAGSPRVDAMKIDVEGMELRVLHGAAALVAAQSPVIVAELSASQLARAGDSVGALDGWLRAHGYRLYVNLHARNDGSDAFDLAPLRHLSLLRIGGPGYGLRDVIAVHRDSDRTPARALSAFEVARRLADARRRDIGRRLRRR